MPGFCQEFSVKKQALGKRAKPLPARFFMALPDRFWKVRKHDFQSWKKRSTAIILKDPENRMSLSFCCR